MAKTSKAKALATPVAQSRDEAERLVARIGELQRELARQDADLGDILAEAKEAAEQVAAPLKVELATAMLMVQGYFEANRDALTGGKTKTIPLTTGKVFWRARPASVSLRGVSRIIAYLLKFDGGGLHKFLRVKTEVDKDAMLKDPELAATIPGVTIGSVGEDFIIAPFEAGLVEARS